MKHIYEKVVAMIITKETLKKSKKFSMYILCRLIVWFYMWLYMCIITQKNQVNIVYKTQIKPMADIMLDDTQEHATELLETT